jgi:hypothetical protein
MPSSSASGPASARALVQKCASEGMKVSAGARDRDRLRKLLDERGLHEAPAFECDVSDPASVQSAFADAIADAGVPDLVVFNASGYARGSILELTPANSKRRGASVASAGSMSARPRRKADDRRRRRHHPVHRRHCLAARQRQFRAVRHRQVRPARAGAKHGA